MTHFGLTPITERDFNEIDAINAALRERAEAEARDADERFVDWLAENVHPWEPIATLAMAMGNADQAADARAEWDRYVERYVDWRLATAGETERNELAEAV